MTSASPSRHGRGVGDPGSPPHRGYSVGDDGAARTAAHLILSAVGVTAAVIVMTTPPLRRLATRATRVWLGASLPEYLVGEARRAWSESARSA